MVVDIPPSGQIYGLGRVSSALHIYDTNNPPGAVTRYEITILNVISQSRQIAPGHTDTFQPAGNVVYVQNNGPSKLQALYVGDAVSPEDAGWVKEAAMPAQGV
ncbi:hypothetical protein WME94_07190 [Sorangium sp. So ce429]